METSDYGFIKTYIKKYYGLDFKEDDYGYEPALSFVDKKQQRKYYLQFMRYIDGTLALGYDNEGIPYSSKGGFSGSYLYKGIKTVDEIMQETFHLKRIDDIQLTLF